MLLELDFTIPVIAKTQRLLANDRLGLRPSPYWRRKN